MDALQRRLRDSGHCADQAGAGPDYQIVGLDSKGNPLDGAKTYKLHLPPNFPVKDKWSMTIYDPQTRSMLQTDQKFAGVNSLSGKVKENKDGPLTFTLLPRRRLDRKQMHRALGALFPVSLKNPPITLLCRAHRHHSQPQDQLYPIPRGGNEIPELPWI